MAVTERGPVVAATLTLGEKTPRQFVHANTEKTNFLTPEPVDGADVMLTLLPSKTWFLGLDDE